MYDVLYVPVIVVFFNKLLRDKLESCVECLFRNKLLRDKLERRAVSFSAANFFSVIYWKDVCWSKRGRERMQTCA